MNGNGSFRSVLNTYASPRMLVMMQPGQSAPEMAAAAAAAAVVREAAANAVTDVLDAGESEEERTTKLAMAKEDKMRKVIRYRAAPHWDPFDLSHTTLQSLPVEGGSGGQLHCHTF